ncbi:hypothetical protein DFA_04092 [Cavenderia fasciculata]|uniref:Calcineurin-like phosphoesterase domain-containing protein n=1 Tax=Cavenderia fasciculata TaxID=261658 RepID=F4Q197_CACFS|nr:uncharacterized protein DFA_04092 [Cavenderia fasciculata]EGG18598.1 hypothetical protein DFA_04092 [Cavenderia fasciculata]|eukprot:XP_004366502.1 hypothetical protein DFA_04092 [Cavenderia fasciculata]
MIPSFARDISWIVVLFLILILSVFILHTNSTTTNTQDKDETTIHINKLDSDAAHPIKLTSPNKTLTLTSKGTFKILQFTDLHYGESIWKDMMNEIAQRGVLDNEPDIDLVVLTGDALSGFAWDKKTVGWGKSKWAKIVQPMMDHQLRWALAMGNHDDQGDLNRMQVVELDSSYPYSLTQMGPYTANGTTNYYLPIYDANGDMQVILYFFDSSDDNCMGIEGWGCVYPDQVEWYRQTSAMLRAKNGGRILPALAFLHIPVPEFLEMWNFYNVSGNLEDTGVCCFSVNTGLFSAFLEMGDVVSIHCGHDHSNDFIGSMHGIQMAYGRKSGYGSYGPPSGWHHGARVIEISTQPTFSINTWIRDEMGQLESTQPFHAANPNQTWNECCDTAGFIQQYQTISHCKQYEMDFRSNLKDNQQQQQQQQDDQQDNHDHVNFN